MPQPRIAVFVLLILAIAGAALLWWPRDGSPPVAPPARNAVNAEGASGSLDAPANDKSTAPAETGDAVRTDANATQATAPSPKGILRVTALWPEAEPATGVMVYLHGSGQGMPYTAFARGITDADGLVVFTGVPLGKVSLRSDRGDRESITVVAGRQDVTFELEGGVAVRGTVVDPDGKPVAGAGVWLQTTHTSWTGGRVVAVSNAEGKFELEHVNPGYSLGAVAAGFAPSKLLDLDVVDTSNPPAVVELELRAGGGRLEGTVTAGAGAPIAGALVAAGKGPRFLHHRGRRVIEAWTSRIAETDANGFFAIEGLEPGPQPVSVRAAGYGLWRGEAEIRVGQTTVIAPSLLPSTVITGVVTDGKGEPIQGARVRAYDRAPGTSFISGGQIDFDETFGYVGSESDAAGRYRVEGVTPGTVHAFAQRGRPYTEGISVAYTQTTIEVEPGSETTWDPEVADGRTVEGIVLYRDGFPMKSVFITLTDEQSGKEHVMTNDDKGEFRYLCLDASTYSLRAQYWDAPNGTPPLQEGGIIPDRGRVELRATYDKPVALVAGTISGRVDDVAGRIRNPMAVHVVMHSDARWFREGKVENGAYRFDRVDPGRFRMTLIEGEAVLAQTDWFELPPAGDVQAPVLRTEAAGSAKITIVRPKGTESFEPKLYLKRQGDGRSTVLVLGRATQVTSDNLTPGPYEVTGYTPGMVALRGKMTVTAGETAELTLEMRAGARCRFAAWWPEGKASKSRHYRILDENGKVFHEYEGELGTAPTRPYPFSSNIPAGRWKVEFTTDDGLRGEAEFEVANTMDEVNVRLDLK